MVMADVYHDQQWVPFDRRAKSTTNAALLLLMGTPAGFFGTLHRKSGRQFAITPRDLPAAADPIVLKKSEDDIFVREGAKIESDLHCL